MAEISNYFVRILPVLCSMTAPFKVTFLIAAVLSVEQHVLCYCGEPNNPNVPVKKKRKEQPAAD